MRYWSHAIILYMLFHCAQIVRHCCSLCHVAASLLNRFIVRCGSPNLFLSGHSNVLCTQQILCGSNSKQTCPTVNFAKIRSTQICSWNDCIAQIRPLVMTCAICVLLWFTRGTHLRTALERLRHAAWLHETLHNHFLAIEQFVPSKLSAELVTTHHGEHKT